MFNFNHFQVHTRSPDKGHQHVTIPVATPFLLTFKLWIYEKALPGARC